MPYELPSNTTNTLEELLAYQSGQIPILWPMILLLIFVTILGSGYVYLEKKTGKGRFSMWFAIAGLITTTLAFILFLIPGLINLEVVSICVIVSVVGGLWFLFSAES